MLFLAVIALEKLYFIESTRKALKEGVRRTKERTCQRVRQFGRGWWWRLSGRINVDNMSQAKLQQARGQVDEVMGVMRGNVERVLARDEKLSQLDERAEALQVGAATFETTATRLRRKLWWKNCKMWAILISVILILIVIIVVWQYS
uniref:Vesicle-associated membrane protein 3 (cellubrevin) n=1 Tax=Eptatretus burgeri TaxID=7764 RepID=A0A8C4Q0D5_EPTBU